MSIQRAIDALTPIANSELVSIAVLPYVFLVVLSLGLGVVLIGMWSKNSHEAGATQGETEHARSDDTKNGA